MALAPVAAFGMKRAFQLIPVLSLTLSLGVQPAVADEPLVLPPLAVLSGDWNGDDVADAVILMQGPYDAADVHVFRGGFRGLEPLLVASDAVYSGSMGGQTPSLEALTPTSFAINSEQIGMGRTPWMQRITVAYRGGDFVVAGFTYDFYDRLDLEHYGHCDVNLLTGDYEKTNGPSDGQHMTEDDAEPSGIPDRVETGRIPPQSLLLQALTTDFYPAICNSF